MKETYRRKIKDHEVIEFTQRALNNFLDTGNPEVLVNGNAGVFTEAPQELKPSSRVPDKDPLSDCTHHWKIQTPQGAMSQGVCKHCEGTKDFYNSKPGVPSQQLTIKDTENYSKSWPFRRSR